MIASAAVSIVSSLTVLALAVIVQRVYFHPLAKYPGPLLWRASRLPSALAFRAGTLPHKVRQFHKEFGDVVRVAPNELSYTDPDAIKDIYTRRPVAGTSTKKGLLKDPMRQPPPQPNEPINILGALEDDHSRIRKAWSPSFSNSALASQEDLVISYVDQMIGALDAKLRSGEDAVDMQEWFSFCTFDIIGALSFGQDFGCLKNSRYHEWVAALVFQIQALVQLSACRYFPWLWRAITWFAMTPKAQAAMRQHNELAQSAVHKRLAEPTDKGRPDFLSPLEKADMSKDEITVNAEVFIFAGSFTLQTSITGLAYFLLKNPKCLRQATQEIRHSFSSEPEFSMKKLLELPYLNACLQEAFRLVSPVPLNNNRMVAHPGTSIAGDTLPRGTIVGYHSWAAQTSEKYFKDPLKFVPERWLNQTSPEASIYKNDRRDIVMPFSMGPRDCIGQNLARMEILHFIGRLLYRFDIELCRIGSISPLDDWYNQRSFGVWERNPLPVRLTTVEKSN